MDRKLFNKVNKRIDMKELIELIVLPGQRPMAMHDYIDATRDSINFLKKYLVNFKSNRYDKQVRNIFDGDLLIFADGYTEYLEFLTYDMPYEDYVSPAEMRWNYYSAHIQQVYAGLHHILALLKIELLLDDENNNFAEEVVKILEKKKTTENSEFIVHLQLLVTSHNFYSLVSIRNTLMHQYVFPLEFYDLSFVLADWVFVSSTIVFLLKLALDGHKEKTPEIDHLRKAAILSTKQMKEVDEKITSIYKTKAK